MKLNELSPAVGQNKKRKRIGRGVASGTGTTSGRGNNGQNSRSGGGVRAGFEGGQMPLHRRLPKLGFTNIFKKMYQIINVKDLNKFNPGDTVEMLSLLEKGIIKTSSKRIKILSSDSDIPKMLSIKVDKVSESAKLKIEAAGGSIEGVI